MKKEKIQKLPRSYDPLKLATDHAERGDERRRLEINHAKKVCKQWTQSAGAPGLGTTRRHFAVMAAEAENIRDARSDKHTRRETGRASEAATITTAKVI